MANQTLRRLKQLEKRLDKVAPRDQENSGNRLLIDREQFNRAMALTKIPYRPEPSQVKLEPTKFRSTPRAIPNGEPEEYSDAARLKRLRDLSRAAEARNKLIW